MTLTAPSFDIDQLTVPTYEVRMAMFTPGWIVVELTPTTIKTVARDLPSYEAAQAIAEEFRHGR